MILDWNGTRPTSSPVMVSSSRPGGSRLRVPKNTSTFLLIFSVMLGSKNTLYRNWLETNASGSNFSTDTTVYDPRVLSRKLYRSLMPSSCPGLIVPYLPSASGNNSISIYEELSLAMAVVFPLNWGFTISNRYEIYPAIVGGS